MSEKPMDDREEWANACTHAIGWILSAVGTVILLWEPLRFRDGWRALSFGIYALSLLSLYCASTLYHSVKDPRKKRLWRLLDHCAIYLLIAGSYTPFVTLLSENGWRGGLFVSIWSLAAVGIVLKLWKGHRLDFVSTGLYLAMGWLVMLFPANFLSHLPPQAFALLVAGGVAYTLGVIFYLLDRRRFFHAIWHLFVLAGSAAHYLAILLYL